MAKRLTYTCSVWNEDGEQIDREHGLTVWDAVAMAQAAQAKGRLAKVTPAVPEKIQEATRARRKP